MVSSTNLSDYIRLNAADYFADVQGERVRVELRRTNRRINSTLHEFVVSDGRREHVILVKSPTPSKQRHSGTSDRKDHPRLFPKVRPEVKSRYEYETMSAIERHVASLADPRFGAVRMYDLLPDGQSLVMEKVRMPSLSELLRNPRRLSSEEDRKVLERSVRNAGAWLRHYHSHETFSHTQPRGASRADFIASISEFVVHAAMIQSPAYFHSLGHRLVDLANAHLPPVLPLGLGHGDYTPSNVLAGIDGSIRVIDTLGRWKAPIYEDISRFLTMLSLSMPRGPGLGRSRPPLYLADLERHFLAGYFVNEHVPLSCIRLFQCQAILERAAAYSYRYHECRGWKRIVKGGRAKWWSVFMRRSLDRLLADTHAAPNNSRSSAQELTT